MDTMFYVRKLRGKQTDANRIGYINEIYGLGLAHGQVKGHEIAIQQFKDLPWYARLFFK